HLAALRFGALLAILRVIALWSAIVIAPIALVLNQAMLVPALVAIGCAVALLLVSFAHSFSLRCVLCRCPMFLPKTCSKNDSVPRFLGSRMLQTSLDILSRRSFCCPVCGERCGCRRDHRSEHGDTTKAASVDDIAFHLSPISAPAVTSAGSTISLLLARIPAPSISTGIPSLPEFRDAVASSQPTTLPATGLPDSALLSAQPRPRSLAQRSPVIAPETLPRTRYANSPSG
ncbi:MAG: hypothetical protein ACC661_05625, partial [Verrucomicrobiales bacterium]